VPEVEAEILNYGKWPYAGGGPAGNVAGTKIAIDICQTQAGVN